MNAATCLDTGPNRFKCVCSANSFTGTFCERSLNPCLNNNLLCNGGTCLPSESAGSNFTCLCPPSFTGLYCQTFVSPCDSSPCLAGRGQCQLDSSDQTKFRCICKSGYTGRVCETAVKSCVSSPCLNNGICQDFVGYYICQCPVEYYGLNCEQFYACSLQPCNPMGTRQCVDTTLESDLNATSAENFKCQCRPGFTGNCLFEHIYYEGNYENEIG